MSDEWQLSRFKGNNRDLWSESDDFKQGTLDLKDLQTLHELFFTPQVPKLYTQCSNVNTVECEWNYVTYE